jgi:hypothetical protein
MLNPRHDNAEMVKALGSHHDPIVSQYSVWAITENRNLSIEHLGLDLRDVESRPDNVKAWIFQLIAMSAKSLEDCREYLSLAISDTSPEVRSGLAVGLRDNYFSGLETLILDWLVNDNDQQVREYITDHIVRMSVYCPAYQQMATELYRDARNGLQTRQRMEANAIDRPVYQAFKKISLNDNGDLFEGNMVMNQTINVGNVQGAAVSIGGDSVNHGAVSNQLDARTVEKITAELSQAEVELQKLKGKVPETEAAIVAVAEAKAEPSKRKLGNALDMIGKVEQGATKLQGTGTAIASIAKALWTTYHTIN